MEKPPANRPDLKKATARLAAEATRFKEAAEAGEELPVDDFLAAAKQTVEALDELNSSYPATREFLERFGVSRVSELDEAGHVALLLHLREVLASLRKQG